MRIFYRSFEGQLKGHLLLLLLLLPITIFVSLRIGYADLSTPDLWRIMLGNGSAYEKLVVFDLRLPRIVLAAMIGMGLASAGCILQSMTRNPLSDPGILGINDGAGLVVMVFVVAKGSLSFQSIFLLPVMAMIGAALVGFLIYFLSSRSQKGLDPMKLILNGIAISAGLKGLMMLLVMQMDSDQHEFVALWQAGSIWKAHWDYVLVLLPWLVLAGSLCLINSRSLDLMSLKDPSIIGLGLDLKRTKKRWLTLAIILAGSCVSVAGSMSFVGLLAPHIGRQLFGNRHRYLCPASMLIGAILVMTADTIARKLIEPSQLPTGIVVAVVGAPYFIYLMFTMRKRGF